MADGFASSSPIQLLLVDDEPRVLQGLRRMLYSITGPSAIHLAESGDQALEILRAHPIDVIISDMRMPEMDGATLLGIVQREYPEVVRIILSGFSEREAAHRAVPVAHQFMSKPCEPAVLRETIARATNLRRRIVSEEIRAAVGPLTVLPPAPQLYHEINRVLLSTELSADAVADVLERDPGMCAKILQIANSAFFGLAQHTASVRHAINYLGTDTIRSLVLTLEVFGNLGPAAPAGKLSIPLLQEHCLFTANIVRLLPGLEHRVREDAYTAALLHDIGLLVLAISAPHHLETSMAYAKEHGVALWTAEETLHGVTHAEVGAYLLGIWGLPLPIVDAVARHHHEDAIDRLDLNAAVHVADLTAQLVQTECIGPRAITENRIDQGWLASVGLLEEFPRLVDAARDWLDALHDDAA
ncbi:MAG: HDOD domain-containing protein [Candidatus Eisenbacteria bacterium]|uniref:HDOD domain-containing protein n=1 Tax=Eiseniibacteriota bacterium TaxID=2212470 RepID=A0A956RPD1_UNCEI|nr:HDOD domain-containing protein [Candidatus Eisenbacteria bacterium]